MSVISALSITPGVLPAGVRVSCVELDTRRQGTVEARWRGGGNRMNAARLLVSCFSTRHHTTQVSRCGYLGIIKEIRLKAEQWDFRWTSIPFRGTGGGGNTHGHIIKDFA